MFDGWNVLGEPAQRTPGFQLVTIAGERFAIDAAATIGVIESLAPTKVPGAPGWVRGVLMWEGQVVPVLGTAERLGLTSAAEPGAPELLHLEIGGEPFLVEVDGLGDIITEAQLEPSDEPLLLGTIDVGGDPVPVLDLKRFTDVGDQEASA